MENKMLSLLSAIRFDSYKSFDTEEKYVIHTKNNITLVIGRNNSGKSSLVDIIENSINRENAINLPKSMENICPIFFLDDNHIERGFPHTLNNITGMFNSDYGQRFFGKDITLQLESRGYVLSDKQEDIMVEPDKVCRNYSFRSEWENVAEAYAKDMKSILAFRRIDAERDILPEEENEIEIVDENGNGATNIIRYYLNTDSKDESIVEKKILQELNSIMGPDAQFTSIKVQETEKNKDGTYKWEIFLVESGKRYAVSKMGSGLKTIILILLNLYLIPDTQGYKNKEIFYAFEEIENNLHPALQRRVFEYLYNYAVGKDIKILITTHSHIAINAFYGKNKAKIYHVIKNNGHSELIEVDNGSKKMEILEDLDVKASDLFQTNGIVWVEGPSDRVYILQWLSVFTDFHYIEGLHFQFMYYGGKLLSHYEAKEQQQHIDSLINVLTINRNAAIVMDSDITTNRKEINDNKKRIKEEFESRGFYCWITEGKEIENYVSAEAVNSVYKCDLPQIKKYQKFPEYIKAIDKDFATHKPDIARKMCNYITNDNSEKIMDLKDKIIELCETIKKWNPQ